MSDIEYIDQHSYIIHSDERVHESFSVRALRALGIAAKNPQRDSARIRSGKPDPKGNAQKTKR